ncbi:MAG: cysteine desulfurase [Treponema sp.]|nr:cysteine desulfurase [Treponema sp.]
MTDFEHYFDWAATSPSDKEILRQSLELTLEDWANPSSTHQAGKNAKTLLESARTKAAEALCVKPENVFFTSGGTESDHIALLSVINKPNKGTVLISSIEHPALREMGDEVKKAGCKVEYIPADKDGVITPEAVTSLLTKETLLVCVMAVNNETGVIQPIKEIAEAITKASEGGRKPKFHVDCVQAAGKIPFNLKEWGVDSAAFSAHKICGPRGTGILYLKDGEKGLEPFLRGGGQEKGIRSGTENVFGALAFSKCLEKYFISEKNMAALESYKKQRELTDKFVNKLASLNGCTIIPPSRIEKTELFSPYVVQAAFKNIPGNVMLRALDSKGYYISTGSACSSRKNNRPVLEAMHIEGPLRETAVRFSFGPLTTASAIDDLFAAVSEVNSTFNS